jgi:hypothetical protein
MKSLTGGEILAKKTFVFSKIAYLRHGVKNCPTEVSLELSKEKWGHRLSICGTIWNHIKTDCYSCGQNLDTLARFLHNKTFRELYDLWKKYHLNDMNAGTHKQKEALEKAGIHDYDKACKYLKSIGLYVDELRDDEFLSCETEHASRKHYEYGHGWVGYSIPEDVIKRIMELCAETQAA